MTQCQRKIHREQEFILPYNSNELSPIWQGSHSIASPLKDPVYKKKKK